MCNLNDNCKCDPIEGDNILLQEDYCSSCDRICDGDCKSLIFDEDESCNRCGSSCHCDADYDAVRDEINGY